MSCILQGAILGPQEFVEGLGIGVKSLGSHAIGGVFGVASSVTASAGQAIAFLSFDEKHKQERRNDMRDKPQHVGQVTQIIEMLWSINCVSL